MNSKLMASIIIFLILLPIETRRESSLAIPNPDLGNLKSILKVNGEIKCVVLYGENAASTDKEAAKKLANSISEDVEARAENELSTKDLQENNLIIVGGPVASYLASQVNGLGIAEFRKDFKNKWYLSYNHTRYRDRAYGFAEILENPYNTSLILIWIAGINRNGTKAAVEYLISHQGVISCTAYLVDGARLISMAKLEGKEKQAPPPPSTNQTINLNGTFYWVRRIDKFNKHQKIFFPGKIVNVWILFSNLTRWHTVDSAKPLERLFDKKYSAFLVVKNYTETQTGCCPPGVVGSMTIAFGIHNVSSTSIYGFEWSNKIVEGVKYDNLSNVYWFYHTNNFILIQEFYELPWTNGRMTIKIVNVSSSGQIGINIYLDGNLINCSMFQNWILIGVNMGPDNKSSIINMSIDRYTPNCCVWATFKTLTFKGTKLNLTNGIDTGDDLNLTCYGRYIEYWNSTLWLLQSRNYVLNLPPEYADITNMLKGASIDNYLELNKKRAEQIQNYSVKYNQENWLLLTKPYDP